MIIRRHISAYAHDTRLKAEITRRRLRDALRLPLLIRRTLRRSIVLQTLGLVYRTRNERHHYSIRYLNKIC